MAAGRTLESILQSTSDTLFPAQMGERKVGIHSRDVDGDTPLHVLVRRGDADGVRVLIEHGAHVNAVGDMGETALHIARRLGHRDIMRQLLDAGADPSIASEFGEKAGGG